MPNFSDLRVEPMRPSAAPKPIRTEYPTPRIVPLDDAQRGPDAAGHAGVAANHVAAATGGTLPPTYSQFVVDPDTNDVLLRVRDGATNRILQEFPSAELRAMSRSLTQYADMLARRHATTPPVKVA
jgi:hypothetical protein